MQFLENGNEDRHRTSVNRHTSSILSSVLSILYMLISATLLLLSSISNGDIPSTLLSIFLFTLMGVNACLHIIFTKEKTNRIVRILQSWKQELDQGHLGAKYVKVVYGGCNEEIALYDIKKGDIILKEDKYSCILDFVTDKNFKSKDEIRIKESVKTFLTRSLEQKHFEPHIFSTISRVMEKLDYICTPIVAISAVFALCIAFAFAGPLDGYGNERFDIAVSVLIVIPLLRVNLPLLSTLHVLWYFVTVKSHFRLYSTLLVP
ncbi:hypothetical protein PFISCL1PPCAC_19869 [Pristionchus fissidentatus]|uniref:G protein-coupled receptor n=1 Tax=Pristionchus fissidentatus TaxID=1538716 RepID=A0AAV5WF55_9BILA|nr:hypothetical protein PFISCL1PPCAC_19869 [Pristionchus fissidentatus]